MTIAGVLVKKLIPPRNTLGHIWPRGSIFLALRLRQKLFSQLGQPEAEIGFSSPCVPRPRRLICRAKISYHKCRLRPGSELQYSAAHSFAASGIERPIFNLVFSVVPASTPSLRLPHSYQHSVLFIIQQDIRIPSHHSSPSAFNLPRPWLTTNTEALKRRTPSCRSLKTSWYVSRVRASGCSSALTYAIFSLAR